MKWLGRELGPRRLRRIDRIEVVGERLHVLSQDLVALIYATKVCLDKGAVPVNAGTEEERMVRLPAWSRKPWTEYAWPAKLRILLGRIKYPVADDAPGR